MGRFTYLIDGNYLLHRIMNAGSFKELNHNGKFTGGIFGFLKSLLSSPALGNRYPNRIIVVWDGAHSTRRKELYPAYKQRKAKSSKVTEELYGMTYYEAFNYSQEHLNKLLPNFGIHTVWLEKSEADDVINLIPRLFSDDDHMIISDDLDYLQCIDKSTSVYRPINDELVTSSLFPEYWPEIATSKTYLIYKSLVGDGSDNIPSIVGDKTALKIIDILYRGIDVDYTSVDELSFLLSHIGQSHTGMIHYLVEEYDLNEYGWDKKMKGFELFKLNYQLINMDLEVFDVDTASDMRKDLEKSLSFCGEMNMSIHLYDYGLKSISENMARYIPLLSKLS